MTTGQIVAIVIAVLIVLAILAAVAMVISKRRRSQQLQQKFGPEYERTVRESDNRKRAEQELQERARRREQLDIRPLPAVARQRYLDQWQRVQATFVDDPILAVGEAESLLNNVMRERGYPVDRFEEQAGLIAVDHPEIVQHYRAAHDVNRRSVRGEATTEEMREAFVHYRALFERLLGDAPAPESSNGSVGGRDLEGAGTVPPAADTFVAERRSVADGVGASAGGVGSGEHGTQEHRIQDRSEVRSDEAGGDRTGASAAEAHDRPSGTERVIDLREEHETSQSQTQSQGESRGATRADEHPPR